MDMETTAANTESSVEIANSEQTEVTTETASEVQASTEVATQEAQETKVEDVTKTQAFAHRLKEETARIKQAERDAYVAEMGYVWNGKPITTEAEHRKAIAESEEQEHRAALAEKGIDPSVFDEYINNNPTVKESREIIAQQKAQQKRNDEYGEFLEYFKVENGRDFNSAIDQISPEVWEMTTKGKSLTDAFAFSTTKVLKAKIAEYEARFKAQETNAANAGSSPGSVTGNGAIKDTTLTPEMIDSMTDQQRMARWPEIKKVLGMK